MFPRHDVTQEKAGYRPTASAHGGVVEGGGGHRGGGGGGGRVGDAPQWGHGARQGKVRHQGFKASQAALGTTCQLV